MLARAEDRSRGRLNDGRTGHAIAFRGTVEKDRHAENDAGLPAPAERLRTWRCRGRVVLYRSWQCEADGGVADWQESHHRHLAARGIFWRELPGEEHAAHLDGNGDPSIHNLAGERVDVYAIDS